jgi:Flagellar transcriptional activator (FlhC)
MRISDDRYSRDRRRYDLAVRFLHHQARTHTIRSWTGLTDDRIRRLYRTYVDVAQGDSKRHRGKSPQQAAFFMRSHQRKYETAVLASLLCLFSVVPLGSVLDLARSVPSVPRGESLCEAFEAYRALLPASPISFDHATFLVLALARGDELRFGSCCGCNSLLVVDRLSLHNPHCGLCRGKAPDRC